MRDSAVSFKPNFHLLLAVVISTFVANGLPVFAQNIDSANEPPAENTESTQEPAESFKKAWEIVKDNYYDSTFNDQDWSRWEHRYDNKIQTFDDAQVAISTMLASLGDKFSVFLSREQWSDEKSQITGRFGGVGISTGLTESGVIEVYAPIPRTPAFRAGLQTGDRIVKIDHKTTPASLTQAVSLIRGRIGTPVTLTISRNGKLRDFMLIRDDIPVYCVFDSRMLSKEIGYIRIDTFHSCRALDDIIENLAKLQFAQGLIVDLRGNPGGDLLSAVDVATLFLSEGTIVSSIGRNAKLDWHQTVDKNRKPVSYSRKPQTLPLYDQQLVVLVDGSTTGTAEVLAAALKCNHRAELVGQKTRGQGTARSLFRLPGGGGIQLSAFQYLSPEGAEIMLGVSPNHPVPISEADKFAGHGPWYTYGRGTSVYAGRSPGDQKDDQLVAAYKLLQSRLKS